jgi:hypothetical protein
VFFRVSIIAKRWISRWARSPEKIRIWSIPNRNWSDPLALGGLGVVGRDGMGVADLEMTPFSLLSFDSGFGSRIRSEIMMMYTRWAAVHTFDYELCPGHWRDGRFRVKGW